MTEAEVKAAFCGIDPQHPFFLAVLQVCDDAVLAEQDSVSVPDLTDAARHFNAGRLAHAKDMAAGFRDFMAQAQYQAERERVRQEMAQQRRDGN